MRKLELVGKRFGRLLVLREVEKNKYGNVQWECLCDCGNKVVPTTSSLNCGDTVSCGCFHKEFAAKLGAARRLYAGQEISSEDYNKLVSTFRLINRRASPNYPYRENYFDKGVTVCYEWSTSNPKGLSNFIEWALSVGGWKKGLDIDKEAVEQGNTEYCPEKCKFVSRGDNLCRRRKQPKRIFTGTQQSRGNGFYFRVKYNSKLHKSSPVYLTEKDAAIARDEYILSNKLPHTLNFPELRDAY